jgi:hypothetical protein
MKCPECGFQNEAGALECEKCREVLNEEDSLQVGQEGPNQPEISKPRGTPESENLHPQSSPCSNCGYPVEKNMSYCPQCGTQMKINAPDTSTQQVFLGPKETRPISEIAEEQNAFKKIYLIPISDNKEPLQYDLGISKEIILSRKDIDPHDNTISSKEHIEFSLQGEELLIKNLSSNGALFKQIKDTEKLEDGDFLLIGGHRYFKVKID